MGVLNLIVLSSVTLSYKARGEEGGGGVERESAFVDTLDTSESPTGPNRLITDSDI